MAPVSLEAGRLREYRLECRPALKAARPLLVDARAQGIDRVAAEREDVGRLVDPLPAPELLRGHQPRRTVIALQRQHETGRSLVELEVTDRDVAGAEVVD